MANKQRFSFTSNALSKGAYLKGFFSSIFFQSKRNHRKTHKLLANYFKVDQEQIFLFGAARMSVFSLIKSMKLAPSDEVIVAGYTCVVLTNAVKFTGCQVRYVDIERTTLNVNSDSLRRMISPSTKLLIVPHNFGIPYNDIQIIKEQFPDLIILEDVAHSFGSISNDKLCGTIGDAGFFSLEYSKPLTAGLGGIMIINNKALLPTFNKEFDQLEQMSKSMVRKLVATLGTYNLNYSQKTTFCYRLGLKFLRLFNLQYKTSTKEIEGELPDNYPVKMSPRLTSFLVPQLKKIDSINAAKIDISKQYSTALQHFSDIESIAGLDQVLVRYPILFKENISLDTINAIKKEGISTGLNFGVWFNDVVHPSGSFRYCYTKGDCPEGEYVASRIINLPINTNYSNISKEMADVVSLFKKHGIK